MLDQHADSIRPGFFRGGFDFAEIQGFRSLKLHQGSALQNGFAIESGFRVPSFDRQQAPFDGQLRIRDRAERNRGFGNHREHGNKSILTARRELLFSGRLILSGERLLEAGEIAKMFERADNRDFDRGEGRVGVSLPPHVSLPLPSLFLVPPRKEKHDADQGGGGEISDRELQHVSAYRRGAGFLKRILTLAPNALKIKDVVDVVGR